MVCSTVLRAFCRGGTEGPCLGPAVYGRSKRVVGFFFLDGKHNSALLPVVEALKQIDPCPGHFDLFLCGG